VEAVDATAGHTRRLQRLQREFLDAAAEHGEIPLQLAYAETGYQIDPTGNCKAFDRLQFLVLDAVDAADAAGLLPVSAGQPEMMRWANLLWKRGVDCVRLGMAVESAGRQTEPGYQMKTIGRAFANSAAAVGEILDRIDAGQTATGMDETPDETTILAHGHLVYSIADYEKIAVSDREDYILQSFLAVPAMDDRTLTNKSGVPRSRDVLKRLRTKYDGRFAVAITMPGTKSAGGYRVRIRRV